METTRYHDAEIVAQQRSGRKSFADSLATRISDSLLPDAIAILTSMPYLVLGALDDTGRPWASIVSGLPGFASVDAGVMNVRAVPAESDPLYHTLTQGGDVGMLTVNLAERIRYRVNGKVATRDGYFSVEVNQCYRNCPQYMHARAASYKVDTRARNNPPPAPRRHSLDPDAIDLIARSDVFFLATHGSGTASGDPKLGADVNHRGGNPGFVQISEDGKRLSFPDYPGNYMFNSVGNLARFPRCGMLFIDFESGRTLHLTGTAEVDWSIERTSQTAGAQRIVDVTIEEMVWGAASANLAWTSIQPAPDLRRYKAIDTAATEIDDLRHEDDVAGFHKMLVAAVVEEGENIRSLYLKPLDGKVAAFKPGQHLKLRFTLPGAKQASIRHYSLSDYNPERNEYRLGIRRSSEDYPGSISRYIHDSIRPGNVILASDPRGDFTLDTAGDRPVALISAGVGITPMLCMLKALARENPSRTVWFAHGTRHALEHAYASEVRRLTDRSQTASSHVRFTQPRPGEFHGRDYDSLGRIDLELITQHITTDFDVYLCGPNEFMTSIRDGLKEWGMPAEQIMFESFGGPLPAHIQNIGLNGAKITFRDTQTVAVWSSDSTSVLDLAERAGVEIMNSCRSGVCGSCEQKLVCGGVGYAIAPTYTVRDGHFLACCAQPISDITVASPDD
ncbi:2Fe-2S iron-sulfur cluster-binding protein [Burkholderia sp. 3C]